MKQCCEYILGLRYKLSSMGISIDETSFIFGYKQSMLDNKYITHLNLQKK